MIFNTLACAGLVGSLALQVAAGPLPAADDASVAAREVHAAVDAHEPVARRGGVRATFNVEGRAADSSRVARRAIPDTHTVHERQPDTWARRWSRVKRAPADGTLPMRVGLKQRNLEDGHDRLMAMSDPKSPSYGKHMTSKEVIDFFAPERESVSAVVAWLTTSGIHIDRISQSTNKQWIQFDATVDEAENLLLTEYHIFEHGETRTRDVAAEHYHVPRDIQPHIDYITPGIRLRKDTSKARKMRRRAEAEKAAEDRRRTVRPMHTDPEAFGGVGSGNTYNGHPVFNLSNCYEFVTPECIRMQYSIPNGTTAAEGNQLGVFESLDQHYNKEDLDSYFAVVQPNIPAGTYPENRLIDGATATRPMAEAGAEAELDFQAVMPLIYPQNAVLFQTDDDRIELNMTESSTYMGFWNTFFDAIDGSYCTYSAFGETGNCVKPECLDPSYPDPAPVGGYNGTLMCGVYKPTNVISISYGGGEADLPAYYWKRQCSEILKLGLQGVTVVISSGDEGVASFADDGGNADGCGGDGQIFYPSSEATCPYVLSVGSTEFDLADPKSSAEVPKLTERSTQRFPSGGGFSNYFPQPLYQAIAVAEYFSKVDLPFKGYFNMGNANFSGAGDGVYHIGGRGYPDVSAIGDYYVTVLNGYWSLIGGTSLSAPVWASVITLINEERLKLGKSTVGFVNPILYLNPHVFNDITVGSNPGCGTNGFPASKGWDPVSGLGSPNFPKLLELFKWLP